MTYADEYEVVGYTGGKKGRDVNAIIWQCKVPNGNTFNVTPKNITYAERYLIYKKASTNDGFNKLYSGRMMTVEYEDLSNDNVPLRAKSIGFRDHL